MEPSGIGNLPQGHFVTLFGRTPTVLTIQIDGLDFRTRIDSNCLDSYVENSQYEKSGLIRANA